MRCWISEDVLEVEDGSKSNKGSKYDDTEDTLAADDDTDGDDGIEGGTDLSRYCRVPGSHRCEEEPGDTRDGGRRDTRRVREPGPRARRRTIAGADSSELLF